MDQKDIKEIIRGGYAKIAEQGGSCRSRANSCCGSTDMARDISRKIGYSEEELKAAPEGANLGLGCGNPVALASLLREGETVLDLGSGAGFDCFLAANKVGEKGKVIGVDMTPEMIEKAKENASKAGAKNVEFRLGEMEDMPIEDESVDWIISNCVINLSPDKGKVFQEAFRVLKPNGRILVSDIVAEGIPEELKSFLWSSCIGGALDEASYLRVIREVGFEEVQIMGRFDYDRETIRGLLESGCLDLPQEAKKTINQHGKEMNARISNIKISAKKKQS